jgi:nucleotide-binding universal stress UspA family protein
VVGVDGSEQGARAVRYAVEEASRTGSGVRLVHTLFEAVPMAPMLPVLGGDTLEDAGRQILDQAVTQVRQLSGDVEVDSVLASGPPARAINAEAADARLVVLGHRHLNRLGRLFTGSTTIVVLAHARCPMVCVPSDWTPTSNTGRVVVGVDGSSGSRAALEAAFEAASARHATLTVLHAWRLPEQYDVIVGSPVLEGEWLEESEVVLSEILAGWRERFPDVEVAVELRYQRPISALTEASTKADLVVVGRHGETRLLGLPLGSITRALINHTHCPVLVVHDPADERSG